MLFGRGSTVAYQSSQQATASTRVATVGASIGTDQLYASPPIPYAAVGHMSCAWLIWASS